MLILGVKGSTLHTVLHNHSSGRYRATLSLPLFITLYKVVLTLKSVHEIFECEQQNGNYRAIISCGTVVFIMLYKGVVVLALSV